MSENEKLLALGAGVALVVVIAVYITSKNAGAAGAGVVRAASDFAGGAIQEGASIFGVPKTNSDDCASALLSGRFWDASFKCPAKDFISGVFGGAPVDSGPDNWDKKYWDSPGRPLAPYELPGVVLP